MEESLYVPTSRVVELNGAIKRVNRLRLKGSILAGVAFVPVFLFTDRSSPAIRAVELGGALLILLAMGLRLWALGSIDGNKKRVLVTWGPYRYIRHPLYTGSMLFALGTCLIAGSVTAALLLCLFLMGFYLPSLKTEEQFLEARFPGEWAAYRARTGRLLPKIGPRMPRVDHGFHLRRPLREIGTLVFLPLVAFGSAALIRYLDRVYDFPDWFI